MSQEWRPVGPSSCTRRPTTHRHAALQRRQAQYGFRRPPVQHPSGIEAVVAIITAEV